jgi:DNA-binding NarL/FixJ family response regulator
MTNTFLIADDTLGKMMMLAALVEKSAISSSIVTAKTTEEAKRLIDAHQIAFAFVDYEMPTEEGPAVIQYLRKKNPKALIAMVTSGDSDRYRNGAKEAGADAFVCTSYGSEETEQKITDLLTEWGSMTA